MLLSIWCEPEMTSSMLRPLDGVVGCWKWRIVKECPRFPISGVTFSSTNSMFTKYISIFKFSHFTNAYACMSHDVKGRFKVYQNHRALSPFDKPFPRYARFSYFHILPTRTPRPLGVIQGQWLSYHVIRFDLLSNIVYINITLLRRSVSETQPFKVLGFELPILTLRGHSRSMGKVNLERTHMIS